MQNIIWIQQSLHELPFENGRFSKILSQKGVITLPKFGGVWPDSNLTFF